MRDAVQTIELLVAPELANERVDRALMTLLQSRDIGRTPSRSQVTAWISGGSLRIDGIVVTKAGTKLRAGALLILQVPAPEALVLEPDASIPFTVLFEDEHVLVIDKPAGVTVHAGAGIKGSTLVNGLLHHFGENVPRIGDSLRPGIVHRLDRDTSGVMVVAKSENALRSLALQLKPPRRLSRVYLALTLRPPRAGVGSNVDPSGVKGVIDCPIDRHPTQRVKMAVCEEGTGRTARTSWRVKEHFRHGVLLRVSLHTGRTHQIRVHCAAMGAPVVGDQVYGRSPEKPLPTELLRAVKRFPRQALHASVLAFDHPVSGERIRVEAPLPTDISALIAFFRDPPAQ